MIVRIEVSGLLSPAVIVDASNNGSNDILENRRRRFMMIYLQREKRFSLHESVLTEQFDLEISGIVDSGDGDVGGGVKNDIYQPNCKQKASCHGNYSVKAIRAP